MARVTTWLFVESDSATAEELSNIIGLECDTSRRKGEELAGRPGRKSRAHLWRLDNRREISDSPDDMLEQIAASLREILGRMSGHERGFASAAAMGDAGLLVGILAGSAPPIIFDAAILKAIAALGVDLEIDLIVG
jgi:hypothetical protein